MNALRHVSGKPLAAGMLPVEPTTSGLPLTNRSVGLALQQMTAHTSLLSNNSIGRSAVWLLAALVFHPLADASLVGVINDDNQIVLVGSSAEVTALDFTSDAGVLVPIPPATDSPFELLIANSNENVAVGTLGPAVTIDGQLNTGVGYNGDDPDVDLLAIWANMDDVISPFPIGFELPVTEPELSGIINLDNQLVLVGENLNVVGIQIQSPQGLLDPIPPGDLTADASPFDIVLANGPTEVTLGNLGGSILVEGELLTSVRYLGDDPSELTAFWGAEGSTEQIAFTITKELCGGSLPGDVDGDGEVGFMDFLILSAGFGEPGTFEQGDLDCDGNVGFPDFLILSGFFGSSTSDAATVPEPNSSSWLAILLIPLSRLRKRSQVAT